MEQPQYSTEKSHSDQNQALFFVMTYFNHKHFASFYSEYLMKDYANRLVPPKNIWYILLYFQNDLLVLSCKNLLYKREFPDFPNSAQMWNQLL